MKNKAVASFVALLCVLTAALFVSGCSSESKITEKATNYLCDKYGSDDFEVLDYTQNKTTNGWYVVNARNFDTDIDFQVYISNMNMTDGYSVNYVNAQMEKILFDGLMEKYAEWIESVQWLNIFEDGYETYRFRDVEISDELSVSEIDSIYLIKLRDCESLEQAASLIYDIIMIMEPDVLIDEVTFDFDVGEHSYIVKANYGGALMLLRSGFVQSVCKEGQKAQNSIVLGSVYIDLTQEALEEQAENKDK